MYLMKTITAAFILSFASIVAASAQSMPSLIIPVDPVSASLAGSGIAREATAFAVVDNASAMAFSQKEFALSAAYGAWAPETADSRHVSAGAFFRIGERVTAGVAGSYLADRSMDITDDGGVVTGSFSPGDIVAGAGVSYLLTDGLSLGVSGKLLRSVIAPDMSGTAFGGDVSLSYRRGALSAAAAVCNLGTSISYGSGSYAMPACVKVGVACTVAGLLLSAEAGCLFEGALGAALGAEYGIADIAFLRAGYHYGAENRGLPSFASAGLGVKLAGVEFNAACLLASDTLGGTLLLGLGYSF